MNPYFKTPLALVLLSLLAFISKAQNTDIQYLSGTDKDHVVEWELKVSGGRKAGQWLPIPVPSNWEMQGFGTYRYWNDWSDPVPDSVGTYRYTFSVPTDWNEKTVNIVFGGVMTDTKVTLNGQIVGPIHRGGFYEFRYDISKHLNFGGENQLEVEVHRFSSDQSVNEAEREADFWLFSGIYRPVWLEALPQTHITRTAIDANHKGEFAMDVFLDGVNDDVEIKGQIYELDGTLVGDSFLIQAKSGQTKATISAVLKDIQPWSAEWPNRYMVEVKLQKGKEVLHQSQYKFGFRTIEVRERDGVYVNDEKVRLKGVNRHSFWPESGRTTSKDLSISDVNLIKDMNMNAVRMSHYPPDAHFLDVTDSLGLYVIDELTGWQKKYNTQLGTKLVEELIIRDVNHPSIILWANGNEGGWNRELDDDFRIWDPQLRNVIHPWEYFGGINTSHYEVYDCCTGSFFHGNELFMPTEFLHGLYDGGHGAGLNDWWNLMLNNPLSVGGFLWDFADEGIVREDWDGKIDVAGNSAPDGIVGPYREKEGSFFTIKEVWSPVYIALSEQDNFPITFSGKMKAENRYDHTNLNQISFSWQLTRFPNPGGDSGHQTSAKGIIEAPDIAPGEIGELQIELPDNWGTHDALYLTATDPYGREIYTWSWMISNPAQKAMQYPIMTAEKGKVKVSETASDLLMSANGTNVSISKVTGLLQSVSKNGKLISLSNGPVLLSGLSQVKSVKHGKDGNDYLIEFEMEGDMKKIVWTMKPNGLLKLNYGYYFPSDQKADYLGVTFDYPEENVLGMQWLGKGPYRVWKNRLKGVEFDVWQKDFNNTITGASWQYPEFKGFHDDLYWVTVNTNEAPITIITESEDLYFGAFVPQEAKGEGAEPKSTHVDFPEGDLMFLNGIAPIGTKFHSASEHGPAGQLNAAPRHGKWYEMNLYFYFE